MRLIRLIGFALVMLFAGCVTEDVPDSGATVVVGDKLPDFTVTLSDGTPVSRDELSGQPSVIVFFNTSCEDCRRELPVIDRVSQRLSGTVTFLAIAREEGEEAIRAFWSAEHLTLPYSPQSGREIYSRFAKAGIPQIFISDASLTIRAVFGPDTPPDAGTMTALIESLVAE